MFDLKAIVTQIRDTLVAELGEHLLALYLFGSAARGEYVQGRSDIDLLLVVDPAMPLIVARNAFRPIWQRHASALGHGPLVATPDDLTMHLALFPSFHRILLRDALRFHGAPVLKSLPPPEPPAPIEDAAYVAARTITYASALTAETLLPERAQQLSWVLTKLTHRVTGLRLEQPITPLEAILALHAKLREMADSMPQFAWHGSTPSGDAPSLLPGCLAFYQRNKHLIAVLERVDAETLSDVDWSDVGAAAEEADALFGLATPWQLRLAASQFWVESLFFEGFDHVWGADIIGDLETDESILLRQLTRAASEQRVERLPMTYLCIEGSGIPRLLHDTQNVLLNAGLRAELYARLTGRESGLPVWMPPDRETPEPEQVEAIWQRWRELTAYYACVWRGATSGFSNLA